jgi:DNA-binding NarL/FixJ family response regulator
MERMASSTGSVRLLCGIGECQPSIFNLQCFGFDDFGVGLNGGSLASPTIRILVVDDLEAWRQRIRSMLQTRPELCVVAEAADGLEAVQKAQELKPDLILLDIGLPNLDGLEAAKRIHQVAPDARIVFLTQNRDKDVVQAALRNGARGYVLKTDAGSELLTAVAGVLGGDDFVSSGIKGGDSGETEDT